MGVYCPGFDYEYLGNDQRVLHQMLRNAAVVLMKRMEVVYEDLPGLFPASSQGGFLFLRF